MKQKNSKDYFMNNTYSLMAPNEHKNFTRFLTAIREFTLPDYQSKAFYLQHKENCTLSSGSSDCQCSPVTYYETSEGILHILPNGNPERPPHANQGIVCPGKETSPGVKTLIEITPRCDENGNPHRQVLVMKSSYVAEIHCQEILVSIRPGITPAEFLEGVASLPEDDRSKTLSDLGPYFAPLAGQDPLRNL